MIPNPYTSHKGFQLQQASSPPAGSRSGERTMPDIAERGATVPGTLERVGMSDIEVPIRLLGKDGQIHIAPALASAFVSLDDPAAKGIHMSRLFLSLQEILERDVLSFDTLADVVQAFKQSHGALSSSAHVSVA